MTKFSSNSIIIWNSEMSEIVGELGLRYYTHLYKFQL